ncbi:MAG TPA: alpha/beta fold hydrolase [Sporichthyaceae bacterium]|jgi:pimeloyl-ACP methyl ester carboxylesterase|nr:alpha/beta fold hydrolase [Sporichthyaceae bacterium]
MSYLFPIVEGRAVRVRVEGDPAAPPVVLVHGIGRSLDDWSAQFPALRNRYRLIALDLPGFGYSQRRPEPASLGALARGVLTTLDALDEHRPVHLVGNSLGGAVSMQSLLFAPARVARLVLVNSAGFGPEVTYILRMLAVPGIGPMMLARPTRVGLAHAERALYADPSFADRTRVEHSLRCARRPGAAQFMGEIGEALGTLRGGIRPEWRRELLAAMSSQQHPMLIVWGDRDKILPPRHFAAARRAFPNAATHMFSCTGHMPQTERADEFATLVAEFLSGVRPATG